MKQIIRNLLIQNWPRKGISLILAIIIWLVVDQSLTATKTVSNIPIRIVNIPEGKTVDGLQSNGILTKKITVTVTGKKTALEDLNSNDLEVIVDAGMHDKDEWVTTISKRNMSSLNPDLNVASGISKVSAKSFIIKLSKLAKEKIPIYITQPIGEAPKGYQFLDIWPYKLYLTISGPEEVVKNLKSRGLKLTFNLNDISLAQLENLQSSSTQMRKDVVSLFVPNQWKQIYIPALSNVPINIDDPDAKYLRIDFIRSELLPIGTNIPLSLFLSPATHLTINPQQVHFNLNDLIQSQNGIEILKKPLFAKGVSELFIEIVKDMLDIVVLFSSKFDKQSLDWALQVVNAKVLEDRYVSTLMSDTSNRELRDLHPQLRQEYLRNRFRNYMNRFQLFTADDKLLDLKIQLKGNQIIIDESPYNPS